MDTDHQSRALATLRAGAITTSVEFRFGADGLIESMYVPARLFDDGCGPPTPATVAGGAASRSPRARG